MEKPVVYYDIASDEMKPITQEMVDLFQEVGTHFMLLRNAIGADAMNGFEIGPAVTERLKVLEERRAAMKARAA